MARAIGRILNANYSYLRYFYRLSTKFYKLTEDPSKKRGRSLRPQMTSETGPLARSVRISKKLFFYCTVPVKVTPEYVW